MPSGHGDHAAEDEREQQHEHDRLQRHVEQLLGDLPDVREVAARDQQRVDGERGHAATSCERGPGRLGVPGQRQEDVVERRLAALHVDRVDARGIERADDVDEAGRARAAAR